MAIVHSGNLSGRDTVEHYIHEDAHQKQVRLMTTWLKKHRPGRFNFTGRVGPDDATVIRPQATVDYGYCWFSLSEGPAVVRTPGYGYLFSISVFDMDHNIPAVAVHPDRPILMVRPGQAVPEGDFHIVEFETDQAGCSPAWWSWTTAPRSRRCARASAWKAATGTCTARSSGLRSRSQRTRSARLPSRTSPRDRLWPALDGHRGHHARGRRHARPAVGHRARRRLLLRDGLRRGQQAADPQRSAALRPHHLHHRAGARRDGRDHAEPNRGGRNGIPTRKPFYGILRAYQPVQGSQIKPTVRKR